MIFNRKNVTHFMIVSLSAIFVQKAMWITCVQNYWWHLLLVPLMSNFYLEYFSIFYIFETEQLPVELCYSYYNPLWTNTAPSATPSTNLAQLRTALNKSDIFRRGIYLVISFAGIAYELLQNNEVRWFLLGGYGFIIIVTLYSFYVQGSKRNEETL